ncbi:FeoA family protein [Thermofilum pendens]|uniref:FeoA family protein n=1 Tax=Thermofilum pendens (strain DSM 2475 / Hrk 5) TaxID=368408 RepID=A1RYU4_THEPD|nr:FeoA family protein [Thermofilum pendens]ABL78374.1 FeoA family protein [Thermofilum pendens Hrk 5]
MQKKLSELKPGEKGIVTRVEGPSAVRKRLLDMGLVKGTEVVVIRRAPLGDPIELLVKGYNLSIRKAESDYVYVLVPGDPEELTSSFASGAGDAPGSYSTGNVPRRL